MEELPLAVSKRILALEGARLTERQREVALDAYRMNAGATERALGSAEAAGNPAAYFVSSVVRIVADEKKLAERSASVRRRHDLADPICKDCADTGFVTLTRDVSEHALAGDAAPCHCALGVEKQRRYGTVHYGPGDYEAVVRTEAAISFIDYARSDEGKADPELTPPMVDMLKRVWREKKATRDDAA